MRLAITGSHNPAEYQRRAAELSYPIKMPAMVNTPELRFEVDASRKFAVIEEVLDRLTKSGPEVDRTDGAQVKVRGGWWLLRASNTQEVLVARAEAQEGETLRFCSRYR